MRRLSCCFAILTLFILGCSKEATLARPTPPGRSANVITLAELAETPELTALQVVQRLKPTWLRTRGRGSFVLSAGVKVYVDGALRGKVGELRRIRSTDVQMMQFISGVQATQRWGTDHPDGAILVTVKKGRRGQ